MSLSSGIVTDALAKAYQFYSAPAQLEADDAAEREQLADEARIIKTASSTGRQRVTYAQGGLASLSESSTLAVVRNKYHDPNVMIAVQQVLDTVFYGVPYTDYDQQNIQIKRWIDGAKKIGAASVAGDAALVKFGSAEGAFVVKSPKNPSDQGLVHELFIGLFVTNSLRKELPNFAYVFGGFDCTLPVFDESKKAVAWCAGNEPRNFVKHIVYESVMPSETFEQYCARCSTNEFMNKYMQVLFAVNRANELYEFSHNDLHSENVLIRDIPGRRELQLPYRFGGKVYYVKTDKIATIIDLGRAHAKVNGKSYGFHGARAYGVEPNKANPLYDAYKLLCWCLRAMKLKENNKTFSEVSRLLKYFNAKESVASILSSQVSTAYSLPTPELVGEYGSLKEFVAWILSPASGVSTSGVVDVKQNLSVHTYGCSSALGGQDKCYDVATVSDQFNLGKDTVNSVTDFYLLHREYSARGDAGQLRDSYRSKVKSELGKYLSGEYSQKKKAAENSVFIGTATLPSGEVQRVPFSIVEGRFNLPFSATPSEAPPNLREVSLSQLKQYKGYVARVAAMLEARQEYAYASGVARYVAKLYNLTDIENQVKSEERVYLDSTSAFVSTALESLDADIRHYTSATKDAQTFENVKATLREIPELGWYFDTLPRYDYLIH